MTELRRNLGFWTVFSITITAMIGTGLFFGIAIAANKAGNLSIISWALLGLLTVYVGACFGELASMFPNAGGIYEFAKQAYGKGLPSFLIGWGSWISINMMNALLIVAALEYLLPSDFSNIYKILLSIGLIILLNFFAFFGTDSISAILGIFATIILLVLITIIVFGVGHISVANFSPFFTSPMIMIFVALFFIVETFFGWENATFMAEETTNPEKTIPKALLLSSIFVSLLGILLAIVMLGIIPWQEIGLSQTPISDLTAILFTGSMAIAVNIGIGLALIGSAAGGLIGTPRLLLGLARDKFFIEQFSDIHPKFQTPYKAIIFQTIISIIVIIFGFGNYNYLLSLLVPIALFTYIAIILSVTILRYKKPNHPRPFRVWFGKSGPIIVSIIYLSIIVSWLIFTPGAFGMLKLGISFILFGIPIFLLLLVYYDPDWIKKINDKFAILDLWFENFNFPKKFRRELLGYFQDLKDKVVLDYGSGVGTLTLHLADIVGPNGKIYATDLSEKNVSILNKRLTRKRLSNVIVIHDEHHVNRIHPSIRNVDVVFSVGQLSYVQDVKKLLKELYTILPKNGKICLVEYIDYFWVIPNVKWLSNDEEIKELFRQSGFAVHVVRKKRVFWNYVIIYGIKSKEDLVYI